MCEAEAPDAAALARLGLVEGPGNVHAGQGTACRRFFFQRQYLELLWVRDETEARSHTTADRWSKRHHGVCPFGLVFRPVVDSDTGFPVPTWLYRPACLPDGLAIEIAAGTPLQEPGIFLLPFVRTGEGTGRPFEHAISFGEITHVRMGTPVGGLVSPAARWAESVGLLSV